MFTGIVAATGEITHVAALEDGLRLTIAAPGLGLGNVAIGDSIAHGGVCLTVIAKKKNSYQVDVSRETLNCTIGLAAEGVQVNLEKAMRLSDFIGGHQVSVEYLPSPQNGGRTEGFDLLPVGRTDQHRDEPDYHGVSLQPTGFRGLQSSCKGIVLPGALATLPLGRGSAGPPALGP